MKIELCDTFAIDGIRRTEDGYLTAFARVARTGIQEYRGSEVGRPDLGTVRIYRPDTEVFAPDAMQSFAHRPVTLTHPKVPVTSKNWSKFAKGQTGGEIVRDGEFVRVPLVMMDQAIIDAYEKGGVKELSMGYSTDLKWEPGTTKDGMTYDAIQTNIRGNHLAVVPRARGGDQLRIGDTDVEDDKDQLGHGSNKRGVRPKWVNMYHSDFKAWAKQMGHTIARTQPHGKNNGNMYTSTDDKGNVHGKFDDFTQSGFYHGFDGRNKKLKVKDADAEAATVVLDAKGDPNHGKVGVVLGLHPTDPSRASVRFGDTTVPYPTKYLRNLDGTQDIDPDLVACPECGAEIPADSDVCPECGYNLTTDSATEGDYTMKQIMIDGVPVDVVNDQGAMIVDRHVQKLETRVRDAETASGKAAVDLADARKIIETKDGEIAVLKKQVEDAKITPEKLDTLVKDRLAVIDRATTVLDKTFAFDGKSIEDIRRAAVSAKLGDAATKAMSDAAVEGAFTALTNDVEPHGGTRQLRDGLSQHQRQDRVPHNSVQARDAAYAKSVNDLSNNWRGKAAS